MKLSFEEVLNEDWRQALVENAKIVLLGTDRFPVLLTPKRHLRQVDFVEELAQKSAEEAQIVSKKPN